MRPSPARRGVFGGVARAALLPPAALAVHQLRYLLAFGGDAGPQLARTGHSYLHSVVPWVVALVALAAGGFLWSLGRALAGQTSRRRFGLSFVALWLVCAALLVAIYSAQELMEGWLTTGHAAGLIGVFGYGGWWSIPAALCVGLVLAALLHGARWALAAAGRYGRRGARPRRHAAALGRPAWRAIVAAPAPLVAGWSGRGPPSRV